MNDRVLRIVLLLTLGLTLGSGPEESSRWWSDAVDASLDRVASVERAAWESALRTVPETQRPGLAFLIEYMPKQDLERLAPAFIIENVELAYRARDLVPWGRDLPEAIFLNDVLPYVNLSEPRDPWRAEFMKRFLPIARESATPAEAAHRLNQHVFKELGVRYSTQRERADQSPAESAASGLASCTGLSIILTDACRAVGVPARVVGIPNWVDKRGNHTWVEVWSDGRWHFVGAAEPHADGLDRAWFVADAALAQRDTPEHAIYALSYRRTGLPFPVVFNENVEPVHAINVTDRYAKPDPRNEDASIIRVRVLDASGRRRAAAVTVSDSEAPGATFGGVSRNESFDTNDVLAFTVARGRTFEITARLDSRNVVARVESREAVHDVDLILDPMPAAGPASRPASSS